MTESYHEISNFLTTPRNSSGIKRENNDSQNDEQNQYKRCKIEKNDNFDDDDDDVDTPDEKEEEKDPSILYHKKPKSLKCNKSFSYNVEGTNNRDGDMTNYVAGNLKYRIKLSHPTTITKIDVNQPGSSKISTPSPPAPSSLLPHNFLNTLTHSRHSATASQEAWPPFLNTLLSQIDSDVFNENEAHNFSESKLSSYIHILNDFQAKSQHLEPSINGLIEKINNISLLISSAPYGSNLEIYKAITDKIFDGMNRLNTIMAGALKLSEYVKNAVKRKF